MIEFFLQPNFVFISVWISIIWLTSLIAILFAYYPIKRILTKGLYGDALKNVEKSWLFALITPAGLIFFYAANADFYLSLIWLAPWLLSTFYIYKTSKSFQRLYDSVSCGNSKICQKKASRRFKYPR